MFCFFNRLPIVLFSLKKGGNAACWWTRRGGSFDVLWAIKSFEAIYQTPEVNFLKSQQAEESREGEERWEAASVLCPEPLVVQAKEHIGYFNSLNYVHISFWSSLWSEYAAKPIVQFKTWQATKFFEKKICS